MERAGKDSTLTQGELSKCTGMKKAKKRIRSLNSYFLRSYFLRLCMVLALAAFGTTGSAQPLPPDDHGDDNHKPPNGSLGGGLVIMLALGAAYGSKKWMARPPCHPERSANKAKDL